MNLIAWAFVLVLIPLLWMWLELPPFND